MSELSVHVSDALGQELIAECANEIRRLESILDRRPELDEVKRSILIHYVAMDALMKGNPDVTVRS